MKAPALGIDIGGSGIKFGLIDVDKGEMIGDRVKIDTPKPSTPDAVAAAIRDAILQLNWKGAKFGVGFPAIIVDVV